MNFSQLTPRQRKLAIAGVAGLLGLIFLLRSRSSTDASAGDAPATADAGSADPTVVDPNAGYPVSSPFDYGGGSNDAFGGQLATAVTDALSGVETQLTRSTHASSNIAHLIKRDRALLNRIDHRLQRERGQSHGGGHSGGGGQHGGGGGHHSGGGGGHHHPGN